MIKTVDIIGVQLDKGASRRGVDMGPSAIRYAGLQRSIERLGHKVSDKGDIVLSSMNEAELEAILAVANQAWGKMHHLADVMYANRNLYQKVCVSLAVGHMPLIIGGDHSIAAGSIMAGVAHHGNIGVIWMDAHCDYNNADTSLSGNLHGMPLSAVTGGGPEEMVFFARDGRRIDPRKVVIVGARHIDEEEKRRLKASQVTIFSMSDIDMYGMGEIAKRAIAIASQGTKGFHCSLDLDCIDPSYAPGVGTPVPGGITYREAHLFCEMLAASEKLLAVEVVELNPVFDERNRTGVLAVELIASLLGKRIS